MQHEIQNLQQQIGVADNMRQQVQTMFNNGVIKHTADGGFEAVVDVNEQESIKS